MIDDYIDKIDMVCGKGTEFVVIVKREKLDEFLSKARRFSAKDGVFMSMKVNNAEVMVSRTGKVLIRCVSGQKEAEDIFQEIIKEV